MSDLVRNPEDRFLRTRLMSYLVKSYTNILKQLLSKCYFIIIISEKLTRVLPDAVPRIPILCVCAPLAGATAACITNPMDVIRARIQVQVNHTFE